MVLIVWYFGFEYYGSYGVVIGFVMFVKEVVMLGFDCMVCCDLVVCLVEVGVIMGMSVVLGFLVLLLVVLVLIGFVG